MKFLSEEERIIEVKGKTNKENFTFVQKGKIEKRSQLGKNIPLGIFDILPTIVLNKGTIKISDKSYLVDNLYHASKFYWTHTSNEFPEDYIGWVRAINWNKKYAVMSYNREPSYTDIEHTQYAIVNLKTGVCNNFIKKSEFWKALENKKITIYPVNIDFWADFEK